MVLPREAWWSPSLANSGSLCASSGSVKKPATCSPSIPRNSWIRCSSSNSRLGRSSHYNIRLLNEAQFMLQALALAREGIALCSPNPHVGAVVVGKKGSVVGRGSYTYDGLKHAEVLALEEAGDRARGSTLYINLEPCSHQGRTPPCAEAVIKAGIARVVAAISDPNPQVSGKGFEKLLN